MYVFAGHHPAMRFGWPASCFSDWTTLLQYTLMGAVKHTEFLYVTNGISDVELAAASIKCLLMNMNENALAPSVYSV